MHMKSQLRREHVGRAGRRLLFTIGNLSDDRLFQAWGSPVVDQLGLTPESLIARRDSLLDWAARLDVDAIEDVAAWAVVETSPGAWDWTVYRDNAGAAARRGLGYIVYSWIHSLPRWVRDDPDLPRSTCLEHGEQTDFPSIFSERTVELYERYYKELKDNLGDVIDLVRFGSPMDYGEVAYPAGLGGHAELPVRHCHEGFWVGEAEARAHFRGAMSARYGGDIAALNRAWGTDHSAFATLGYPERDAPPLARLDFVTWYHDALTERAMVLIDVVKRHFPRTPIVFNFGWAFEKTVFGFDAAGIVREATRRGIETRFPGGACVGFLYTKRMATICRHYQPPAVSSEPGGGQTPEAVTLNLFKDLTTGVTWHFDYPDNNESVPGSFSTARALWKHGDYPLVDCAVFFPTTYHRLLPEAAENLQGEGATGYPGYPPGLISFAESLRSVLDYDVVDETLIAEGALSRYRVLIWPIGDTALEATLTEMVEWVRRGGVLLVPDVAAVHAFESGAHALMDAGAGGGVSSMGAGCIVAVPAGDIEKIHWLREFQGCCPGYDPHANPGFAAWLADVRGTLQAADRQPALQLALDRLTPEASEPTVLSSRFEDGLMLHNTRALPVSVIPRSLGSPVDLGPLEIRWVPLS